MEHTQKSIVMILSVISIVGIIGIPMGDPKFIINAIILESIFITLAVVSVWRLHYTLIPNIVVASSVIVGNTLSPRHIEIMSTFEPLENAVVLISGGYILPVLLTVTSAIVFKNRKDTKIKLK